MHAGIVSCGVYIPRLRIKREEYQRVWGYFAPRRIEEKSVTDFDEDSITMGFEAASNVLKNAKLDATEIDAVYFASTSPPYAEKQSSSTIATALGCRLDIATLDATSSIKSGTSALLSCLDFVNSGRGKTGLVVAADCPRADPTDPLEHQLGAAAAAMIVSCEQVGGLVDGYHSVASESLGERFRRNGQDSVTTIDVGPYHEMILDEVVTSCVKGLLEKLHHSPKQYDWFVLQGLDDAKGLELCKRLGFEDSKITPSIVSTRIGDTGAASPLLALSKVLESALPKQSVILCSYGPGAGADALSLTIQREMKPVTGYEGYMLRKEYVDYTRYLKLRKMLGKS